MTTIEDPRLTPRTGKTKFKVHIGAALELFGSQYPTIHDVVLELVQNEIDAEGKYIRVRINYVKGEERTLTVAGDGTGATVDMVAEAFANVANRDKPKGKDKYGQFRLGFMSPLGKCSRFALTTCHCNAPPTEYRTWSFDTERVVKTQHFEEIGWNMEEQFVFAPDPAVALPTKLRNRERVSWRTRVHLEGVTTDRRIARIDLDELTTEIARRFRDTILERGINIKVSFRDEKGNKELTRTVSPQRFQGRSLNVCTIANDQAGTTEFQMFLAFKGTGGRNGQVEFSTRSQTGLRQRLTIKQFRQCIDVCGIPMRVDILNALESGVFEGEIIAQKVKLNPNRTSFADGEPLWGFCESIEQWFREVGSKHYEAVQRENQEYRYTKIGDEALEFLQRAIRSSPGLMETLCTILPKGVNIPRAGKKTENEPGKNSPDILSIQPTQPPTDQDDEGKGSKKPLPSGGEKVISESKPRGGLGLRLEYVESEMTRSPYELDLEGGVLRFNTLHQFWSYCNPNDRHLRQYITVAVQVALLEARYQSSGGSSVLHHCLYDLLRFYVVNILNSGYFTTGGSGAVIKELVFDA